MKKTENKGRNLIRLIKIKTAYRRISFFIFAAAALLFSAPLCSSGRLIAPPALIVAGTGEYSIGKKMEVLEDPTGKLSFSQVSANGFSGSFRPVSSEIPNFGFSTSAWWLRFRIHFAEILPEQQWILTYKWPFVSHITAYIADSGDEFRRVETGIEHRRESRDVANRLFMFRLNPEVGTSAVVYLRIQSGGILILPLSVISAEAMHARDRREYLLYGLFSGLILSMICYYLLMFFSVRDPNFLFFALFILFQTLYHAINQGIAAWALGFSGAAANFLTMLSASALTLLVLLFSRPCLFKDGIGHAFRSGFILFEALFALYPFAALAAPDIFNWKPFFALTFFAAAFLTGTALYSLARGTGTSRTMLLFLLVFLLPSLVTVLLRFGFIPYNQVTQHVRAIAIALESLLLALFIHLQIRDIERQRITAKAELIAALEEGARMKDEFLTGTSHELRKPLQGIAGLCDLLRRNIRTMSIERIGEDLGTLSENAREALARINDLLDYAKLNDPYQNIDLELRPVGARSQVAFVFALLAPLTEGRALELRNSIKESLPPLYADEQRFRQILITLVSNAIRYCNFGVVEVSACENTDGTISVSVSDSGIGIDDADYEEIFADIARNANAAPGERKQTGVGLAIVKKLVAVLGGGIRVESSPGRGMQVTITLPRAAGQNVGPDQDDGTGDDAGSDVYRQIAAGQKPLLEKPGGEALVLIVDDDRLSRKILRDYFAAKDYRTISCDSAKEAQRIIATNASINMVLLDMMLPQMPGLELLRLIRLERPAEDLPVIITSGRYRLEEMRNAFASGANDYLIKPFNIDELQRRVDGLFSQMKIIAPAQGGIAVRTKDGSTIVHYRDICHLEALGKRSEIHLADGSIVVPRLLKSIEERLPESFLRIHRGCIVNCDCIEKIVPRDRWSCDIILSRPEGRRLSVGRSYLKKLRERFS